MVEAASGKPTTLPVTIWGSPSCAIDFFKAGRPSQIVVFTFNWVGNRKTDGLGFGGRFLLDNGFDVIAIKTTVDEWFHNLPEQAFTSIDAFLEDSGRHYSHRCGYGSSMGGYGAIRFSQRLRLDRVLALSPQYDIGIPEDFRYQGFLGAIGNFSYLTPGLVAAGCTYTIVYDDTLLDRLHAAAYERAIPPKALRLIRVRYAGHPVGFMLEEIGELQPLARQILAGGAYTPSMQARKRAGQYLFGLARHCVGRGKMSWALAISNRHLAKMPNDPEGLMLRARLLQQLGDPAAALDSARAAIAAQDTVAHYKVFAANLLEAMQRRDEAIALLEDGLSRAPSAGMLEQRLKQLRASAARGRP